MLRRFLPLFVLALVAFVVSPALAQEEKKADANTHTGQVAKVAGNKLTMKPGKLEGGKFSAATGAKEHTHTVAPDAKITLDGKKAELSDLKPGMFITVTTKEGDKTTAVKIAARTLRRGADK